MDYYLVTVYFFLGYFICLLPKTEEGDAWWIEWLLPLICAIAALIWPITLTAVYVARHYEMKRRNITP